MRSENAVRRSGNAARRSGNAARRSGNAARRSGIAARRFPHKTPQGAPKRNHHNHRPDQLYQQPKLNEFIDKFYKSNPYIQS
jgi:hypothetical protein